MEFLIYLTPIGRDIIQNVIRAKFKVRENIEFCRDKNYFGYVHNGNLVICTKNIKSSGLDVGVNINETLYHEATHIAQECNGNRPFNISLRDMKLPPNKLQDIQNSIRMTGGSARLEHEAFWMEDKPEKVNYVLKKYCFR